MEKCLKCEKEYKNLGVHMKMAHDEDSGKDETLGKTEVPPAQNIEGMLQSIMRVVSNLDSRISKFEIKERGDQFKTEAKTEDVESFRENRKNVDERIVKMVNETLGEDFGIEIDPRKDQPGFLFTLIVPERLSDTPFSSRPMKGEDGKYVIKDNIPTEEEYKPQDRRSRAIASYQSYEAIKDHCEKVRSYIVAYYQKMQKPIPEFKLK